MFVGIDIGASGTRYITEDKTIRTLPNNMVFLTDEVIRLTPHSSDVLTGLEVIIKKNGAGKWREVRALMGDLANRFSASCTRPTCMRNKIDQKVNFVSVVTATALSLMTQNKLTGEAVELFLALPPIEVKSEFDKVNEEFLGSYTVTFTKFNYVVEFEIKSVKAFEESFLAMLSYFFEIEGGAIKPKPTTTEFGMGRVLSIDAGASTTDLVVVENLKYLEKTGQTYKIGGNIACENLIDDIRGKYGFDMPMDQAQTVLAEGRMAFGNKYEDVSGMVEKAKRAYAAAVVEQVQTYFRKINMPLQSMRAVVVSGGGSMQSQYVEEGDVKITTPPMSQYITEELMDVCDGIEVRQIDGNPRYANIQGLMVRITLDMARRAPAGI